MLEHFFKSLVATVSDPYQCNRITDALAAAGIKFYCKSKTIFYKGIMPSEKILDLPVDCNFLTGSVNL